MTGTINRVAFLVDGFNLYHSSVEASKALGGGHTKWLDLKSLCEVYLPTIGQGTGGAKLQDVYYFSALAWHIDRIRPGTVARHETFIKALRSTGVVVELAQFKKCERTVKSFRDGQYHRGEVHEEKETDVSLAVKLMKLFITNACDSAVMVTGDTDLAPAVRTAQELFPHKSIWFAFPFKRKSKELAKMVSGNSFMIKPRMYARHQFPDPYILSDGPLVKPAAW